MKRTTNLTGALSSASNSIPAEERPNDATTSSMRSEEAWGMAMPNPMPVLMVSSRCLREARMLSRSSDLILPWATRRSINSTMALQRSVAFISGMICSAESRLAKDMQVFPVGGRKLNVGLWDDKRDLAGAHPARKPPLAHVRRSDGLVPWRALDRAPDPGKQLGGRKGSGVGSGS